jgi:hypothetical protein
MIRRLLCRVVPTTLRRFTVVGTGQPLPNGEWRLRGSTVTAAGALVWHRIEDVS